MSNENKLSIEANKVVVENLQDYSRGENIGANVGGIGLNNKAPIGQTGVQYGSHDKEQNSNATFVNTEVTEAGKKLNLEEMGINTDISKAQVITKDEVVEQIDTNLHTDLLNTTTRKQLADDVKKAGEGLKDIGASLSSDKQRYEEAREGRYSQYYKEQNPEFADFLKNPDKKSPEEMEQLTKDYVKYMTGKDVDVIITATGEGSGYIRGDQLGEGKKDVFVWDLKELEAGGDVSEIIGHEVNHVDDHRRGRNPKNETDSNSFGDRFKTNLGEDGASNGFDLGKWREQGDNSSLLSKGTEKLNTEYEGYEKENSSYLDKMTRDSNNISSTKAQATIKLNNKKSSLNNLTYKYEKECSGRQTSSCNNIMNQISVLEKEINYLQGVSTTGQGTVYNSEKESQKNNGSNKTTSKAKPNTSNKKTEDKQIVNTKKVKTKSDLVSEMYSMGYSPDQYEIREEKGGVLRVVFDSFKTPDNLNYDNTNVIIWSKGADIPLKVADTYLNLDKASEILTQGHLTDTFGPVLSGGLINKYGPNSSLSKVEEKPKYLSEPAKENGTLNIGSGQRPTEGAYNIDYKNYNSDIGVYKGDATNLSNVKTGSQNKIILDNPFWEKPLNSEINRVLEKGGTVELTTNFSNPHAKDYLKMTPQDFEKLGYEYIRTDTIKNDGYMTTTGKIIKSETLEKIILRKK